MMIIEDKTYVKSIKHFSLRKLSYGLVSIGLGITIFNSIPNSPINISPMIVHAETNFEQFIMDDTTLSIGESTTLRIVFSNKVFGLGVRSFQTKGVTLGNLATSDGGKTWTATVVPLSNYSGSGRIYLKSGSYYNALDGSQGSGQVIRIVVDTIAPPTPSITFEDPGSDGIYNKTEVGPDGTITAKVTVPDGTEVGDVLMINGTSYTVTQEILQNGQEIEVVPGSKVTTRIIDKAGNEGKEVEDKSAPVDYSYPDDSTTQLMINNVTVDNIITSKEAQADILITGQVSGVFTAGDDINLTINNVDYQGKVDGQGNFSIAVKGSDLVVDSDQTIDASLNATNVLGNDGTIETTKSYILAPVPKAPIVTPEDSGVDGVYSQKEVGSDDTVTVTVTVPTGTVVGDTLTINNKNYEVTQDIITKGQLIEVKPGATVTAYLTNTFEEFGPTTTIVVPGQFKVPDTAPNYELPVSDFVAETKVPDTAPSYELPVSDFVAETKVPDTAPSYELPVSDFVAETKVPDTAPSYELPKASINNDMLKNNQQKASKSTSKSLPKTGDTRQLIAIIGSLLVGWSVLSKLVFKNKNN